MAKPPTLLPGKAYIHVSSAQDPSHIAASMPADSQWKIQYLGPVGELDGEHLYEIHRSSAPGQVAERGQLPEGDILKAVKGIGGVKNAKMVEMKARAKREEL